MTNKNWLIREVVWVAATFTRREKFRAHLASYVLAPLKDCLVPWPATLREGNMWSQAEICDCVADFLVRLGVPGCHQISVRSFRHRLRFVLGLFEKAGHVLGCLCSVRRLESGSKLASRICRTSSSLGKTTRSTPGHRYTFLGAKQFQNFSKRFQRSPCSRSQWPLYCA